MDCFIQIGLFTRTCKSTDHRQASCSFNYTNNNTIEDFGGRFGKHQHSSSRNQICDQLWATHEDCARH